MCTGGSQKRIDGPHSVKYSEAEAGSICAVTGLSKTYPGEGFGIEEMSGAPVLEPVVTWKLTPVGCDTGVILPKLYELEEEEPGLHVVWEEALQEIQVQIMGEVQTEVLKTLIRERFGIEVELGAGNIIYKETIADTVEGVGHFEPLRHYAEVHLLLEPGERGSGLQFASACSEDVLDKNWQRLVLTHLAEKEHKGVLCGAPVTDMKITLIGGRAHQKHTEGGDFRQATYRAVRQGLMEAHSVLLEPYYEFRLKLPEAMIGRAMMDIEKRYGRTELSQTDGEFALLTGIAPVATMQGYSQEVIGYTRGQGSLFCSVKGYDVCHNAEEVIAEKGYDPEGDPGNPTGSVFCAHGAGFVVPWDQVKTYMHVESLWRDGKKEQQPAARQVAEPYASTREEPWIDREEIDRILNRTFYANSQGKAPSSYKKRVVTYGADSMPSSAAPAKKKEAGKEYLLVDGYNIIFAWEDLKELADVNVDGARGKLLDILCNYQGVRGCELIVVFDAYKVKGHQTEILDYHNIHVVYTREAETADQYIEKFAHENGRKYRVTVATSDCLEQVIVMGQGCELLSARELKDRIREADQEIKSHYQSQPVKGKRYLLDEMSGETAEEIRKLKED